jgi:hypothetical protein
MAILKLDLDGETYQHLVDDAVANRRPIAWQAEMLIRRALGLAIPYPRADARRPSSLKASA